VRWCLPAGLLVLLAACGHGGRGSTALAPRPLAPSVSPQQLDQHWTEGLAAFRHGQWKRASELFDQVILESPPGDPRIAQAHFYQGEVQFARGENLDAVRQFRRVSDEAPNDPLAPEALLRVGDAYADLWRRPELDPTYGQTALAAYQELVSRYPGSPPAQRAQLKIRELEEKFALKQYKAALYYLRYKAYDSAILYLKDLVATYPRASVAPEALIKLVGAYRRLGYQEDVRETCGYLRRFHPKAPGIEKTCPAEAGGAS
jgi:outer membrane protein assembly factor BamD